MKQTHFFYQDKPLFGLDIGFSSIKLVQVIPGKKNKHLVCGYGATNFDPTAIKDGVISDIKSIAKSAKQLFSGQIVGEIATRRVAVAIPSNKTFSQLLTLPKMAKKDLHLAVMSEIEQYIPVQLEDLYTDYNIIRETANELDLQIVASPKKIVDSYLSLMQVLGLETVAIETTTNSSSRVFIKADQSNIPTILIDFGSVSSDITIFDQGLVATGTVSGGSDNITQLIAKKLKVSQDEAHIIKTRYGLSKSRRQSEITEALQPMLDQLAKEIRRMIRYYEERSADHGKINQIVTMGGGANMPGLSDYLTNSLRLASRMCDPWKNLSFGKLQPPSSSEKAMYITATGLAMINPKDIFS